MATVTGLTAERMAAIEAASVVDGEVVGDNLILTRFDDSTIDAGNVRGPTGSPGITGGELADEIEAAFLLHAPICSIIETLETVAPNELWLTMVGQTVVDGETLYPGFWSKIPAAMKSGSNIIMPNTKGKVSIGLDPGDADFNTIGETGGSKLSQLVSHFHSSPVHTHGQPAHTHDLSNHQHTAPSHGHSFSGNTGNVSEHFHSPNSGVQFATLGASTIVVEAMVNGDKDGWFHMSTNSAGNSPTTSADGLHSHPFSGGTDAGNSVQNTTAITNNTSGAGGNQDTLANAAANTGSAGVAATSTGNVPPYIVFLKIIKVA